MPPRSRPIFPQPIDPAPRAQLLPFTMPGGVLGQPKFMRPTLYVATTNAGKLRDFARATLGEAHIHPLPGLAAMPEPEETALTFEGNARIKAIAYSLHAPGKIVIADDSGIEVDALGGAPGVYSARYAQRQGFVGSAFLNPDARNNECLLANASHLVDSQRMARYRCVIAAARDGEVLAYGHGALEGVLLKAPRGSGGFGYDPVFLIEELGLTMAELTHEARMHYSHRVRALASLMPHRWLTAAKHKR
jgi:XTP/dITP diphosphohydrolase